MEWNKEHKNENRQERGKLCLQRMEAEEVVQVYENYMRRDFPKNELKPLSAIQRMLDRGMYDCLGLYEDNRLMAYGFFVTDKKRGLSGCERAVPRHGLWGKMPGEDTGIL